MKKLKLFAKNFQKIGKIFQKIIKKARLVLSIFVLLILAIVFKLFAFGKIFNCNNQRNICPENEKVILSTKKLKIVSLAPAITQMIEYLGAKDQLVGISYFCHLNDVILNKNIKKVGMIDIPSNEIIYKLQPDYVLATNLTSKMSLNGLQSLGLQIEMCDTNTLRNLLNTFEKIAYITNKTSKYLEWKNELDKLIIQANQKKLSYHPKILVVYEWSNGNRIYSAGKNSFIDTLITLAGGQNIANEIGMSEWPELSKEWVIKKQPDIIIEGSSKLSNEEETIFPKSEDSKRSKFHLDYYSDEIWNTIPAVKNNRIYKVPIKWLEIPGIETKQLLKKLVKII